MRIISKLFQRRCNVCKRYKEQARQEQIGMLETCGIEHCPFHSYIREAIREVQKAELLYFYISKDEVLEDETIQVSWQTKNCKSVSISNYGEVDASGIITLPVTRGTRKIEINIVDLFDDTFEYVRKIKVRRKPTLKVIECKEKILIGESFFISYKSTNAESIFLKNEGGIIISDLSNTTFFKSQPLSENAKLTLIAIGKYGGETHKEINIEVFEAPIINYFRSDNLEKIDTLPIFFEFDYKHESKAEIYCNDILIADVTGVKTFTHIAENKTQNISIPKFELIVIGHTGTIIKTELSNRISIYPQPSINEIIISPDKIILFPTQITLTNHSTFCESILLSDGKFTSKIKPNDSVTLNPSSDIQYFLTPIGKRNFHGSSRTISIEVVYPIEIEAMADKKVTLPNIPVTISWYSKNHTQIFIEPGNIDVTNLNSCNIRLEKKTTVKVRGINKKDNKYVEIFIDVLAYPRLNEKIFGDLPKLTLQIPEFGKIRTSYSGTELSSSLPERKILPIGKIRYPFGHKDLSNNLSEKKILPSNLLAQILGTFKNILPKIDFIFFRTMRSKMFNELKSMKRMPK